MQLFKEVFRQHFTYLPMSAYVSSEHGLMDDATSTLHFEHLQSNTERSGFRMGVWEGSFEKRVSDGKGHLFRLP